MLRTPFFTQQMGSYMWKTPLLVGPPMMVNAI
jgi:hypothetical protein